MHTSDLTINLANYQANCFDIAKFIAARLKIVEIVYNRRCCDECRYADPESLLFTTLIFQPKLL